jgi:RimJ/RimL family protein N-acetyltransferase
MSSLAASPASWADLGHGRALLRYDAGLDASNRAGLDEIAEAVRPVVESAFDDPRVQVLLWTAPQGDWSARRVAWRLGFTLDGTVRRGVVAGDRLQDAWVGTLLPGDAREPRAPWQEAVTLEGHGVRLRRFVAGDVPRIVEACADPVTQRWLGQLPSPYTESDALAYLETIEDRHARNAGITWAVVEADERADGRVLASVGFFDYTPGVECEIGYWAHPDARGRGVVTGAMSVATAFLFGELKVNRVKAFAAVDNAASRRVIEKCGYTQTGVERLGALVRNAREDMALYDLLASEWAELDFPFTRAAAASTANPASESAAPTSNGER